MVKRKYSDDELERLAIQAAEEAVRQFGTEKTKLVDVAKAIGVSHSLLYRVFPDRAALLEAVSNRWLAEIDDALSKVSRQKKSPRDRIISWFVLLHKLKVRKGESDPNLFATFRVQRTEESSAVSHHLKVMHQQLEDIVREGVERGEFQVLNASDCASMLFEATLAFHHPTLLHNDSIRDRTKDLTRLIKVLIIGISRVQQEDSLT